METVTAGRRPLSASAERERALLRTAVRVTPVACSALLGVAAAGALLHVSLVLTAALGLAVLYAIIGPPIWRAAGGGGNLRRVRSELRAQLTGIERALYYSWAALAVGLPWLGVALAVAAKGTVRDVGIALLFGAVVLYAVPVSPILDARIRRRASRTR